MRLNTLRAFAVCAILASVVAGQETRSSLFGYVYDPQAAVVTGATVSVRNADTGVALATKTNEAGYY